MSNTLYIPSTPSSVKDAQGLHLLTTNTPNGQAVQILLEELHLIYGTTWTTTLIDIKTNVQKREWFLRLNPNGRIPTLIDNTPTPTPFPIHESSAQLLYLAALIDKDNVFTFTDDQEQSEVLQWTFFWHGSVTPYLGQLIHFTKYASENIPYAITRYRNEVLRVFNVLEIRLSGKYTGEAREYLAGRGKGKYSVADVKTWPWVKAWERVGLTAEEMQVFPSVLAYVERIERREAVKRGIGERYKLEA